MDKKNIKECWEITEYPIYLMILWSALNVFFPITNLINNLTAGIIGWLVSIIFFGHIAKTALKKHDIKFTVQTGAFAGAIVGLAGALISILAFYFAPGIFTQAISNAVAQGATEGTVTAMMQIGLYFNLILTPIIYAIVGTIITWIATFLFKK